MSKFMAKFFEQLIIGLFSAVVLLTLVACGKAETKAYVKKPNASSKTEKQNQLTVLTNDSKINGVHVLDSAEVGKEKVSFIQVKNSSDEVSEISITVLEASQVVTAPTVNSREFGKPMDQQAELKALAQQATTELEVQNKEIHALQPSAINMSLSSILTPEELVAFNKSGLPICGLVIASKTFCHIAVVLSPTSEGKKSGVVKIDFKSKNKAYTTKFTVEGVAIAPVAADNKSVSADAQEVVGGLLFVGNTKDAVKIEAVEDAKEVSTQIFWLVNNSNNRKISNIKEVVGFSPYKRLSLLDEASRNTSDDADFCKSTTVLAVGEKCKMQVFLDAKGAKAEESGSTANSVIYYNIEGIEVDQKIKIDALVLITKKAVEPATEAGAVKEKDIETSSGNNKTSAVTPSVSNFTATDTGFGATIKTVSELTRSAMENAQKVEASTAVAVLFLDSPRERAAKKEISPTLVLNEVQTLVESLKKVDAKMEVINKIAQQKEKSNSFYALLNKAKATSELLLTSANDLVLKHRVYIQSDEAYNAALASKLDTSNLLEPNNKAAKDLGIAERNAHTIAKQVQVEIQKANDEVLKLLAASSTEKSL
jgi:hypothetical protein